MNVLRDIFEDIQPDRAGYILTDSYEDIRKNIPSAIELYICNDSCLDIVTDCKKAINLDT